MAEPIGLETHELLDAADRAIARSRELVHQRREMIGEWEKIRRAQEVRLALRREIWKPK
jgi:hypothetical protein